MKKIKQYIRIIYIFTFINISPLNFSQEKKVSPHLKILFLGDSLTHGYGVKKNEAFPYLVKQNLEKNLKRKIEIINAGSSGATTSGASKRLLWQLKRNRHFQPNFLILALGANDGLRGLSLSQMKSNLSKVIEIAKKKHMTIILCGMKIPPNYGLKYSKKFEDTFKELAKEKKIKLLPFLLKDVAAQEKMNLSDGIHPNVDGHKIIAKHVSKSITEVISHGN